MKTLSIYIYILYIFILSDVYIQMKFKFWIDLKSQYGKFIAQHCSDVIVASLMVVDTIKMFLGVEFWQQVV